MFYSPPAWGRVFREKGQNGENRSYPHVPKARALSPLAAAEVNLDYLA